jgi:hypothetical protein
MYTKYCDMATEASPRYNLALYCQVYKCAFTLALKSALVASSDTTREVLTLDPRTSESLEASRSSVVRLWKRHLWASSGASVPSILARICSPMLGKN